MLASADKHPLWAQSILVSGDSNRKLVPTKYLSHQPFEDLYALHEADLGTRAVSTTTLRSVWHQRWRDFMPFRYNGQDKRCKHVQDSEQRAQCSSPEGRKEVHSDMPGHIDATKADFQVWTNRIDIAEEDANHPTGDGWQQLLDLTFDGMTKPKSRSHATWPRVRSSQNCGGRSCTSHGVYSA